MHSYNQRFLNSHCFKFPIRIGGQTGPSVWTGDLHDLRVISWKWWLISFEILSETLLEIARYKLSVFSLDFWELYKWTFGIILFHDTLYSYIIKFFKFLYCWITPHYETAMLDGWSFDTLIYTRQHFWVGLGVCLSLNCISFIVKSWEGDYHAGTCHSRLVIFHFNNFNVF